MQVDWGVAGLVAGELGCGHLAAGAAEVCAERDGRICLAYVCWDRMATPKYA